MSNKITLTFDDTLPISGKVINLNQIDSLGVTETITWTYQAISEPFNILPRQINPPNPSQQPITNAFSCYSAFNRDLNPALYSVIQADNKVVVTTLTDQFTFDGANSDFDGVNIEVDYTPLELSLIHI